MSGFYRHITAELQSLNYLRRKMQAEFARLPEGSLRSIKVNGHSYLRRRISGKDQYLSLRKQADVKIAMLLRRKRYLKEILAVLDNNIRALTRLKKDYKMLDPKAVSDKLSEAYHLPPGEEREVLPGFFPQRADDMPVRSKSEGLIALILEAEGLEAQYEREILLEGKVFRPDFTIRHPKTNELIYFEHFGIMDDPGYYRNVVEKLMIYWRAGIRLGENLIVTFETRDHPLTPGAIRRELARFFKE